MTRGRLFVKLFMTIRLGLRPRVGRHFMKLGGRFHRSFRRGETFPADGAGVVTRPGIMARWITMRLMALRLPGWLNPPERPAQTIQFPLVGQFLALRHLHQL